MLTLANLLAGSRDDSEQPMTDSPFNPRSIGALRNLRDRRRMMGAQQMPPGKDGVTPLMIGEQMPIGKDGVNPLMIQNQNELSQVEPSAGLSGLPPGILAILAARLGGNQWQASGDPKMPIGKDGKSPLMIGDSPRFDLSQVQFGLKPGGY